MRDVGVNAEHGTEGNLKDWVEPWGIREWQFHASIKNTIADSLNGMIPPQDLHLAEPSRQLVLKLRFIIGSKILILLRTGVQSASSNVSGVVIASVSIAMQLSTAPSLPVAAEVVTVAMVEKVAKMMQNSAPEIDTFRPLYSYGVESLASIEMRNWLSKELKFDVTLFDVLSAVPIGVLCKGIAERCKMLPKGFKSKE